MAGRRYELTDFEWSVIEPLLPNKPRGVPRADDRKVLNGIYWRLHKMVDSSSIRVHQHAANVKKGAPRKAPPLGTSLTPDAWGARGAV